MPQPLGRPQVLADPGSPSLEINAGTTFLLRHLWIHQEDQDQRDEPDCKGRGEDGFGVGGDGHAVDQSEYEWLGEVVR